MSDVTQWLELLGLGKYADLLSKNDIDSDILPYLTEEHLKELKISIGDRVRLLRAIETLKATQGDISVPDASPSSEVITGRAVPVGDAERRHLTVMFCDLVGSTELSARFDPEDLREIIGAYQDACAKVIKRYEGFIARYMGDGVLVYFGYPQAHGNDADRSARAGLDIVDVMADVGASGGPARDLNLAVRVGINTGLVVVGDLLGEGASEEASVIGETPNIAARLQALAQPNQVVIGPLTHELIRETFICEDLGEQDLKGIAKPVHSWRVVRQENIDSSDETKHVEGRLPLVGRQEELGLLLRSWEASKEGHGQVVLIQGEAGIGKSRLLSASREQVKDEELTWVTIQCSPYHTNSTLYPVIEHMKRVFGWQPEDTAEVKFEKLEVALNKQSLPIVDAVPLYAELMSLPLPEDRYAPLELSAKQKREQTLDALAGWLLEEAERKPVLQVWEDLHWVDPTTLEYLVLIIEQSPTVSMLNVLTYRPRFVPPWSMRSHITPITLNRLERPEIEALIEHQANGKIVPKAVIKHIVDKADGVPLYVEELTKTILESDYLKEKVDRYTLAGSLSDLPVPATLQDSLMARLDRIPKVRELAQLGAVLGREFAYEILQAVAEVEEPILHDGLGQLVDSELLYQRGRAPRAKYIFKHALIQDAAYESLLKSTRQKYHLKVAQFLEERFIEDKEEHPELVAHHYTEAGSTERAVLYWRTAGERARAQSANLEAIAHLTTGIQMLLEQPENEERAHQELALQVSLGHANIVAKGHGSTGAEAAYARALALCEQLGDVSELVPTLFGLWRFYVVVRPLDETNDVALRIHRLAEEKQETELRVIAHYALGYTALCMGDLGKANLNLAEGIAQYEPSQRSMEVYKAAQDPGVACRAYLAITEWLRGYPEQAQRLIHESIECAEKLSDAFSLAYTLCFPGVFVSEFCGSDTKTDIEQGLEVATEGGFSLWVAFGKVQLLNLQFKDHPSDSTLNDLRNSILAIPKIGVHINTPYYMTLLARAYQQAGRIDDGLQVLEEAGLSIEARGERWWEVEIHRLKGELLLSQLASHADDAEACFEQALSIAQNQEAKSLELRAAMSLSRLWLQQSKQGKARDLLSPIYTWFAEGFDTADLVQAKALLEELR